MVEENFSEIVADCSMKEFFAAECEFAVGLDIIDQRSKASSKVHSSSMFFLKTSSNKCIPLSTNPDVLCIYGVLYKISLILFTEITKSLPGRRRSLICSYQFRYSF